MTLAVGFGQLGGPDQWYLSGTDISVLPHPGGTSFDPSGSITTVSSGDWDNTFIHGGQVFAHTDGKAYTFDVVSSWNTVKNVQVLSDQAQDLTFDGFVHVDINIGSRSCADSSLLISGAKRGNIVTGAGDDHITIEMANSPDWVDTFRINSGAGDDVICLRGLDVAAQRGETEASLAAKYGLDFSDPYDRFIADKLLGVTPVSEDAQVGDRTYTTSLGAAVDTSGWKQTAYVDAGCGNDVVVGYNSQDNINGGAGCDWISGGGNNDVLDGGTGNDRLFGGTGNDTLLGGDGCDRLSGESGNDLLDGGKGADVLCGGEGRDVLTGGAGNDILTGGSGADIFVFDRADMKCGWDIITDFCRGEDKILITGWSVSSLQEWMKAVHKEGGDVDVSSGFFGASVEVDGRCSDWSLSVLGTCKLTASDFIFSA